MTPFTELLGIAVPLLRPNVDTDAIIPSREIKGVGKAGLAQGLFAGWRYARVGDRTPDPDFVLNDPAYAGASILLSGENFGCGSSREHAVWALAEYGFRAIIAVSFSPIFENNCLRNGVLAASVNGAFIDHLAACVAVDPQAARIKIDLQAQVVRAPDGREARFPITPEAKMMLTQGLDAIAVTLASIDEITAFRTRDRALHPWVYAGGPAS